MSDHDEPELDELERQLDAAFATTRPRRGFEDELWSRLQARGPLRRAAGGRFRDFPWAAVGGVAVLLVVVLGAYGLVVVGGHRGGGGLSSQSESRTTSGAGAPAARPGALIGSLPTPAAAGVPQVVQGGRLSSLPIGAARMVDVGANLPQPGPSLPVYSYDAAAGPSDGTVLEPGAVPPGLQAAYYPTRQPGVALSDAAAKAAGQNPSAQQADVTLTQARLVYVAVVSGGRGYLEPAYLFTGSVELGGTSVPAQVLVPAVASAGPG